MLKRDLDHKVLLGVCSGLSEYYSIDANVIRFIFIIFTIFFGIGIIIYLVLGFVMSINEDSSIKSKSNKLIDSKINTKNIKIANSKNPKIVEENVKVINSDMRDTNNKNLAYIFLTIGILILLSYYTSIFSIIASGVFWGFLLILIGIKLITGNRKVTIPSFILIIILCIILTALFKELGIYLSSTLPYPYNNYF